MAKDLVIFGTEYENAAGIIVKDDSGNDVTLTVGGGGSSKSWVRPSDWPDLSKMDVSSGNILYMTSYADKGRGFCSFSVTATGGYTVDVGHISGSTYVADSTQDYSSDEQCELYYGEVNGTYKVLRVTATNGITKFNLSGSNATVIGGVNCYTANQGIIDIVGKLPSCTEMSFGSKYNLVNVEISGVVLSGACTSMFAYCYSLASVDVSEWNTDAVTGMSTMFYNCNSLISLDVSKWDTGSVTTMYQMFYGCSLLTSLDVSEWNTSSVTSMGTMFSDCTSLTSLDVSGWNTGSVTNMASMFSGCYSLTSLDVSEWNTDAVTSMNSMFYSCSPLTSLDVSEWNTSSVTNMGSMFYNCYSLTSLDVSKWNTGKVTSMSQMFYRCYSLDSLDVSGWNTSSVTNMSSMFYGCSSLTSLDVSEWNTGANNSTSSMFSNCNSLISLDVSGWNTGSVTTMSAMFSNCNSLISLDVSKWNTGNVTNMSQMFYYCYCLTSLDVSGWDFSKVTTTSNAANIFAYCYGLRESLTLPATMTMIGSNCFYGMRSLSEWHFLATTPPTLNGASAFSYMTDFGGKKIYVPLASVGAYKTASSWSTHADYIYGE